MKFKKDIVKDLGSLGYNQKQMNGIVNDVLYIIARSLVDGEAVRLRGFGTFDVKRRNGHMAHDINTGVVSMTDPYYAVSFRPGKSLRAAVKEKDASLLTIMVDSENDE